MRMVHYGLWGEDTHNEDEALARSIHTLVSGCNLGPEKRVLDAGCGLGGPAVFMAREFGAHVTGLTNCGSHVTAATDFARQQGVANLVDFHHGDFMNMPFPDETFDVVTNHESFCYATDKLAYLKGVCRILRTGGRLQMVEGLLSDKPMPQQLESVHVSMQKGFHMPPLISLQELLNCFKLAGFHVNESRDLDREVSPSTESLRKRWKTLVFLSPPPATPEQVSFSEFMNAGVDFDRGLHEGVFTYRLISATKT